MSLNKKINIEINDELYDYKLFDTLKSINVNKSQRKAAKDLGISHTVLNRRILKAESLLSEKLVTVSNRGSYLTEYALNLLEEYESYEQRLVDYDVWTVAGGFVSCEFIRELAMAYQLENIKILQTDLETSIELANKGIIDILGFDDPVQAYIRNLEPVALGRDKLMLLTHGNEEFNRLSDLNNLKYVEVEGSAQRLAWTTLANYDLGFDIVSTVSSFHEAIRIVEQNPSIYTFINNSLSYTSLNTNDILSEDTRHIISALNVKNDVEVESFLNFASHNAQKLTVEFGFEQL